MKTDTYGALAAERANSVPEELPIEDWWWD